MNQCTTRGKALSEFNGVNISGHDFVEVENRADTIDDVQVNIQTLKCNECGYISEGWIKL